MLQADTLRTKDMKQLLKMLEEEEKNLEKYVNDVYKGKEKNLVKSKLYRKNIAKIRTIINEKKFLEDK